MKSAAQEEELRRWAIEQAVHYADRSNIVSVDVVKIAEKFREYAENGTVPR